MLALLAFVETRNRAMVSHDAGPDFAWGSIAVLYASKARLFVFHGVSLPRKMSKHISTYRRFGTCGKRVGCVIYVRSCCK